MSLPPSPSLRATASTPALACKMLGLQAPSALCTGFETTTATNFFSSTSTVFLDVQAAKGLACFPGGDGKNDEIIQSVESNVDQSLLSPSSTAKKRRIVPRLAPKEGKRQQSSVVVSSVVASPEAKSEQEEQEGAACILLSLGQGGQADYSTVHEEVLVSKSSERTFRALRRMHTNRQFPQKHLSPTKGADGPGRPIIKADNKMRPTVHAMARPLPSLSSLCSKKGGISGAVRYNDLSEELKHEIRVFPSAQPIMLDGFPLWYRRFRVSSCVGEAHHQPIFSKAEDPQTVLWTSSGVSWQQLSENGARKMGIWKEPEDLLDLYSARWMRGVGRDKEAMCPVCYEEGRVRFLKSKTSQYNYHLINQHGISPHSKQPLDPPIAFRTVTFSKAAVHERERMLQGECHACSRWINLESVKEGNVKVPEIYWWKHASQCHKKSETLPGTGGIFVEDAVSVRGCFSMKFVIESKV